MAIGPPSKPLFSEMVRENPSFTYEPPSVTDLFPPLDSEDQESSTNLSPEEKMRIYAPWKHSVIIKLLGKKLRHQYFKKKL